MVIFKTHEDLSTRQINELIQSNQELNQQIKMQEAAIENLSSPHNSTGGNNDEVIKLKKQIDDLKSQQKTILTENSELKSQMLAKRSLKITYDSLVSLSSRFIKEATEYSASVAGYPGDTHIELILTGKIIYQISCKLRVGFQIIKNLLFEKLIEHHNRHKECHHNGEQCHPQKLA